MKYIYTLFALVFLSCSPEMRFVMERNFSKSNQPLSNFDSLAIQSTIDYNKLSNWIFHNDKHNPLKIMPSNYDDSLFKMNTQIDVFYIHPTTYYSGNNWNAKEIDFEDDYLLDLLIKNHCSIFAGVANIYAPYYRQMHIKGYFDIPNGLQAINYAYNDVFNAFKHYLNNHNNGKKFIIASHSQGTNHAERLIKEYISQDKNLSNKMILAYLIGMPIEIDEFDNIKACKNEYDINCFISWRTFEEGYFTKYEYGDNIISTNPITWSLNNIKSVQSQHKGILFPHKIKMEKSLVVFNNEGMLWLNQPNNLFFKILNTKNYHIYDMNLFWLDIRENLKNRINNITIE